MTKARDLSNIIEAGGNLNVTGDLTSTNITATGYIAGPATFVIDPAAVGDNTGTLVVAGNLQVDGTTTTINSTTMTVNDLNITLASGAENSAAANGAGLTVDGASATLLYTNLSDSWSFNKNVGIGTSSPSSYNTNFNDLVIDGGTNSGVTVVSGTTGDGTIAFADGTTGDEAYRGYIQYTHAGEDLKFGAAGAERMRLDASGNVGIGCTPDTALNAFGYTVLEVAGATTTKSGAILLSNSSGTDFGQIYADNADGWKFVNGQTTKSTIFYGGSGTSEQMRIDASGNVTIKSGLANGGGVLNLENTDLAVNGQDWGSVNFISNDSSTSASGIRASIVGTSTSFNGDGNLVFSTAPSNGVNTEAMRINSSGNATFTGTISSGALTVTGAITATDNITAYFSDERFKTKTRNIENPLEKVQALSGFMFVENELARSLGYKNDKEQVALSAQEVQAVLPEAVSLAPIDMKTNQETGEITSKSGEDYLTVDYAKLVPLLVEAIKELKDEVDELKKRIK